MGVEGLHLLVDHCFVLEFVSISTSHMEPFSNLEVTPPAYHAGLEVVPSSQPPTTAKFATPEQANGDYKSIQQQAEPGSRSPPAKRRLFGGSRNQFLLAIAVVILIAAVVTLGVVLGIRAHRSAAATSTGNTTAPASSSSTPSPTPNPTTRQIASLSVTGWRNGNDYSIRLFSQGPDNLVRMSRFESTSGKWASPSVMYTGIPNGPLAAMGFWKNDTLINEKNLPHDFQTELFSIGENSNITEWSIVNDSQNGPIPKWNATRSTNIACYWPICAWQDDTGTIRHFWYDYNLGWFEGAFPGTLGTKQSGLGIIPMQQTFEGISIFYQRDDGVLAEWWQPDNGAWTAGPTLDVLPKSAQLGVFAIPRDDGIHTNRYILWQNSTGDIIMKWDDGPTGWKGPVGFPALKGADNGTQIACLTPANKYHSPMGNKTDMGRCYFQVGGAVREVLYANRDWTIVGNVSIS